MSETTLAQMHYVVQAGANQGLLAGGIGGNYRFLSWAATFGLTPSIYDDTVISQLNGKLNFRVLESEHYDLQTGVSLLLNQSSRTFFVLPEKYPDDDYYQPNAYFFALQSTLVLQNGLFFEASIIDYYLEVLVNSPRGSLTNGEVISLGLGKII